ncbi:MAG: SRPBCC family protein [Anaerolineales bacterium]|nr:SRPBCC family protein [Anaerolineales bacterium]
MTTPPQTAEPVIRRELTVPLSMEGAFALFTEGLARWWPPAYTWSQDVLDTIAMEPWVNGRCYERGPHDFTCDWGRVLAWEPPHRLVFTWQISPDRAPEPNPTRASEVEVRFEAKGALSTRLAFVHRYFGRHGADGARYRAMLDAPEGWSTILNAYAEQAGRQV